MSIKIIRLLDPELFLQLTPISETASHSVLKVVIHDAQEFYTQQLLGSNLYRKLLNLVDTGDITAVGNEKYLELLENYVYPALVKWAYHDAVPALNLRMTDKGVMMLSDTNAAQASVKDAYKLQSGIANKAQLKDKLAVEYLCENSNSFQEYNTRDQDNGGLEANKRPFTSGIVYSKGRGNKDNCDFR